MRRFTFIATIALIGGAVGPLIHAQEQETSPASPREQIAAAVQSYQEAFNGRDVEQLVSHWSPEGVYRNRQSGEEVVGHEALNLEFTTLFAQPDAPELKLVTESIDLVSPNVALESGTATVIRSSEQAFSTRYQVVFVQREGRWLIDRVSEDEAPLPRSSYEHLKPLEWLIGDWVEHDRDATIKISNRWTRNRNFISRTYHVREADEDVSSGLQIIGWDAADQQIRSWLFDSEGGVITGRWIKRDDLWVVHSLARLSDGQEGSFTSVFRPITADKYGWKKINRMINGNLLPNLDEVIVLRK